MEQQEEEIQPDHKANKCLQCGVHVEMIPGKNPLCPDCRTAFIKFPIPRWIKLFGAGVVIALGYALISLPATLNAGIHFERGSDAAKRNDHFTAQQELQMAVSGEHNFVKAKCALLISAFHNEDYETMQRMSNELNGVEIEDEELLNKANVAMAEAGSFMPSDSFAKIVAQYNNDADQVPLQEVIAYLQTVPDDYYACMIVANSLFETNKPAADSVLDQILTDNPGYRPALQLKAPLKRELGQFDSSYHYIDKLLQANRQSLTALSARVRTLLKEKRDAQALKEAEALYRMDPTDMNVRSSYALALHFNNKMQERDGIMNAAYKDTASAIYFEFAKEIINGKRPFRN
jgi:hypothetical protein